VSIKTEMQGPSGYLKKVRDQYLPSSRQMAELAYQRYTEQHGFDLTPDYIYQHADDVLKDLFIAETEIFNEKNQQIVSSVIPYYFNEIYRQHDENYPETSQSMDRLASLYSSVQSNACTQPDFVAEISETICPIIDVASFSQKQSAKSRVGNPSGIFTAANRIISDTPVTSSELTTGILVTAIIAPLTPLLLNA